MKFIGITGGVGAGKSEVLSYLEKHCSCRILLADQAANELKEPGRPCYLPMVELLGRGVLTPDGSIDHRKMADRIFSDPALLARVNGIIHPAVKTYILEEVEKERQEGKSDFFFLEAALLIEEGYGELTDELWYIYAKEEVRRERLMRTRGYSQDKVRRIMDSQLPEEEFRKHCAVVIENNGDLAYTYRQLDRALAR